MQETQTMLDNIMTGTIVIEDLEIGMKRSLRSDHGPLYRAVRRGVDGPQSR